jgi:hypothetical protein
MQRQATEEIDLRSVGGGTVFLPALALHWSGWLTIAELKTLDHRFHRYEDPPKPGTTSCWLPWMSQL